MNEIERGIERADGIVNFACFSGVLVVDGAGGFANNFVERVLRFADKSAGVEVKFLVELVEPVRCVNDIGCVFVVNFFDMLGLQAAEVFVDFLNFGKFGAKKISELDLEGVESVGKIADDGIKIADFAGEIVDTG